MKFIIDQQLPRRLCTFIQSRGHDAVHVKELSLAAAEDGDIWSRARELGAVIVSKDEDFVALVRRAAPPQVVWVRTGNCGNNEPIARMDTVWLRLIAELDGGAALIEVR